MSNYHRWGTPDHLWGDSGRLWGDPPDIATDTHVFWIIEVDWANSGTYTGENEAPYCIDMETNSGRKNRLNIDSSGNANGIQMPSIGTARIVLDNTTRRFDPYNTSGALYGNILPGRYIKIRAMFQGDIYPVFHGNIVKITAQNGVNPTITLDCEDGMRLLQGTDVSVALSENVYMPNAIYQILQDINWPTRFGYGTLLTGSITPASPPETSYYIPYFSADGSAKERIQELCNSYRANFWIDRDGAAQVWHFASVESNVATNYWQENNTLKDINVPMPWENIITVQRKYYNPKVRQATGTIWQSADNTSSLAASASIEIWAEYTFNNEQCQALGVIAPVANTDYTMNTASDGSGTDLTASFTVVQTDFGNKSKLVITNNSASTGYITLLKIRGDAIANTSQSYILTEDTAAIAIYERKTLTLNSPYTQLYSIANLTNSLTGLSSGEIFLEVSMEGRPLEQLQPKLFNGLNCYFPTYGINFGASAVTRIVGHINNKWLDESGQLFRTTIILEDYR